MYGILKYYKNYLFELIVILKYYKNDLFELIVISMVRCQYHLCFELCWEADRGQIFSVFENMGHLITRI